MWTSLKQHNYPMDRRNALSFLFLILLPGATSHKCGYSTTNFRGFNNGTLFPLDTDGLVGRYAGAWNHGNSYSDVSFQLWFLSYDSINYFLSLVAIRNPSRAWELRRPMILWSASRETGNYVRENAALTFTQNGFQLRDNDGRLAWSSSNITNATDFCMSDLNDILIFNGDQAVGRASDFPSNTLSLQKAFLPGNSLVSWASRRNATKGPYSLEMKSNGLALKFKTETYWNFSFPPNADFSSTFSVFCWQNNGLITLDLRTNYSGLVAAANNFLSANSCAQRPPANQTQLLMTITNLSYATFVRLEENGDLVLYTWNEKTEYWRDGYNFSTGSKCFLPSQCGPYGLCNKTTGKCIESCPSNISYCNINVSSDPDVNFEFHTVPGRDYFSINYTVPQQAQSQEQCMQICKSNPTCKAAFFKQTDCFLTHEDVQTLQTGDFVAFIKASKLEKLETIAKSKEQRRLKRMDIGLEVLVPALVLLIVCLAWTWKRNQTLLEETSDKDDSDMEISLTDVMPRRFTYKELEKVTGCFSDCLGEGGFGSVYKGMLPDETVVAVKKLLGANQRSQDFYAEIASLARTNHLNLVRFLGFCAQGPTKRLLVYEFMVNGSLDKWIFEDENKVGSLSWRFKYQIAAGTAQGLCYLHEQCAERIIHLDLKPENVLLDGSFIPKIADFGLSKMMNREVTYLQITRMRGTPGYLAPEYLQVGTITEKSDVFSFGVLLLEIITGRRNKSLSRDYLTSLASATASRSGEEEKEVAARLRTVAYLCIQDDPDLRPSMSNVVKMMEGVVELPKPPLDSDVHFFLGYRSKVKLPISSSSASISASEKTKFIDSSASFGTISLGGPR